MTFCPNCKQQDCKLFKGRNGDLYELELDLNEWGRNQNMTSNNIVKYTAHICNVCGNFFAIGEKHTRKIEDNK